MEDPTTLHSEEDATITKNTLNNPWRLATVTEVEEVKLVIRLLPIWVAALLFATLPAQISTFYTRQGNTLNVNLSKDFKIPAASLQSFIPITIVCLIPIYDRVFVPVARHFTGNVRGISMLQRIGIGIFLSLLSMVAAAITEIQRVKVNNLRLICLISIPWKLSNQIQGGCYSVAFLNKH